MAEPKGPFKLLTYPPLELHLDEWARLSVHGQDLAVDLKSVGRPELTDAVFAFKMNTTDYCGLSEVPSALFVSGKRTAFAEVAACTELYGTPRHETDLADPPDEVKEQMAEYLAGRRIPPFDIMTASTTQEAFDSTVRFAQFRFIAIMKSQVISCWTAFETLSRDLWVAAVNARPRLAIRVLGAEPEQDDDQKTEAKKRKIKFPFSVGLLSKWDYDLTNHMGDALAGEQWTFDRKEKMKQAYEAAFGKECQAVIDKVFNSKVLGWLSAIRNNLVHRAGVIDGDTERQMKDHQTLKLCKADGEAVLPIEGKLCAELVKGGCEAGVELIRMVNSWLTRYPT